MQNILVVIEKNSFFVNSTMEQLKERNYSTILVELDIQKISQLKDPFEAILLYIECDAKDKSQELVYLRDKAVEEDIPIFYMGEDVSPLADMIPPHILKDVFQRPIDVKLSAKKLMSIFNSMESWSRKRSLWWMIPVQCSVM